MPFFISRTTDELLLDYARAGCKVMRKISSLLSGLFLILVFTVSATFTYFNSDPISISVGAWQSPSQPISVWIIGAFVLGGLIGLLFGLEIFKNLKLRAENRYLNRQLDKVKKQVLQLRGKSSTDL